MSSKYDSGFVVGCIRLPLLLSMGTKRSRYLIGACLMARKARKEYPSISPQQDIRALIVSEHYTHTSPIPLIQHHRPTLFPFRIHHQLPNPPLPYPVANPLLSSVRHHQQVQHQEKVKRLSNYPRSSSLSSGKCWLLLLPRL